MAAYLTSALIYDQLADGQAHADALNVIFSCSSKLAEQLEELVHIFCLDSTTLIDHIHVEKFFSFVVEDSQRHWLLVAKLERVLRQVNEYLLETNLIANERRRQRTLNRHERQLSLLHFSGLSKHTHYELKCCCWVENFFP